LQHHVSTRRGHQQANTLKKHLKLYAVALVKTRFHFLQLRYVLFHILCMLLLSQIKSLFKIKTVKLVEGTSTLHLHLRKHTNTGTFAAACRNTLIYTHTTPRTVSTCDVILGSLTLSAPEAGDFVELTPALRDYNFLIWGNIRWTRFVVA